MNNDEGLTTNLTRRVVIPHDRTSGSSSLREFSSAFQ